MVLARFISWVISFLLTNSSCEAREECENYKMKHSCQESSPLAKVPIRFSEKRIGTLASEDGQELD